MSNVRFSAVISLVAQSYRSEHGIVFHLELTVINIQLLSAVFRNMLYRRLLLDLQVVCGVRSLSAIALKLLLSTVTAKRCLLMQLLHSWYFIWYRFKHLILNLLLLKNRHFNLLDLILVNFGQRLLPGVSLLLFSSVAWLSAIKVY